MGIHMKRESLFIGGIVMCLLLFTWIFMNIFKTNVYIDRKLLSTVCIVTYNCNLRFFYTFKLNSCIIFFFFSKNKKWFRVECLNGQKTFNLENLPNYIASFKKSDNVYCK